MNIFTKAVSKLFKKSLRKQPVIYTSIDPYQAQVPDMPTLPDDKPRCTDIDPYFMEFRGGGFGGGGASGDYTSPAGDPPDSDTRGGDTGLNE